MPNINMIFTIFYELTWCLWITNNNWYYRH